MRASVTAKAAQPTRFMRRFGDGAELWRTEYIGPPPSPRGDRFENGVQGFASVEGPQVFLVEQGPGSRVPPHFHHVDQFQVIVRGSGTLGAAPVAPLSVHYAGAYTAYGPICAGSDGLAYFTLRASSDTTGAQWLPEARERMKSVARRYLLARAPTGSGPGCEAILDEPDGIGAWRVRLAAGESYAAPAPARAGAGGYAWVVTAGELAIGGSTFGHWSCGFVAGDEAPLAVTAGGEGCESVVVRFASTAS